MEKQGCSRNPVDNTWVHTVIGIQNDCVKSGCNPGMTPTEPTAEFIASSSKLGIRHHGLEKGIKGMTLRAVHFHCHAPTCLSMSIADNKTGEMLCASFPTYGGSDPNVPHASNITKFDKTFEENGFIAVPPCLFGEPPLEPPPDMTNRVMRVAKTSNATYGHHGEMAHGQFYWSA